MLFSLTAEFHLQNRRRKQGNHFYRSLIFRIGAVVEAGVD